MRDTLLATGFAPNRLEIEITKTAPARDQTRALPMPQQRKALGLRIAKQAAAIIRSVIRLRSGLKVPVLGEGVAPTLAEPADRETTIHDLLTVKINLKTIL